MSWADAISDNKGLLSVFDGGVPPLVDLRVDQIIIDQGGLYLSLAFRELPAGMPLRWIERNYDAVDLRLCFTPRSTQLQKQATENGQERGRERVDVTLTPGNLVILSRDRTFSMRCVFEFPSWGNFHAYNIRQEIDLQERWSRRLDHENRLARLQNRLARKSSIEGKLP